MAVVTSSNPLRANSPKEYTGYKNRKYKEEIIKLTPGGATREIEFLEETHAEKFLKGLATGVAIMIVDTVGEEIMGPADITLSTILISLPTAQEQSKLGTMFVSSHETSLTQKFTYIKQDDGHNLLLDQERLWERNILAVKFRERKVETLVLERQQRVTKHVLMIHLMRRHSFFM